jgi:tartrate dehydrogenase/decarboxylase/D-malate dehydrogenase
MTAKFDAMKFSMVTWDETPEEIFGEFSKVLSEKCYVDALAMNFVRRSERYDAVVGSNLFGEVLSDLGVSSQGFWVFALAPISTSNKRVIVCCSGVPC